jgi:hypothetical protein
VTEKERAVVNIARKLKDLKYTNLMTKARTNIKLSRYVVEIAQARFTQKGKMILELQAGKDGRVKHFIEKLGKW